ncbi:hypothetical protein HELRODRAFT_87285 [Helobdella robusta]|uniref:Uncharacterized protein n=1 Tax=Helobdella robusta TaxID=6412 RepID=T1G6N6_HELRO|nr:hypothetical protein HELRODRAFT_87285 [Helobdella robusta]ESN95015.1 hypothetical protein HELRODRAFT_87285 [Helobdella robusta]
MNATRRLHQASSSLASVKEQLVSATKQRDSLMEELSCLERDHRAQIEQMKEAHETDKMMLLKEEAMRRTMLMEQATKQHLEEMHALRVSHSTKLDEVQQSSARLIQMKEMKLNEEMNSMTKNHEQTKKVEEITMRFEQMKLTMHERVECLRAECDSMRHRESSFMESCQQEAQMHVQNCLARYKHLPQEIESLKAVLDLKNKEMHALRMQNMELMKEVCVRACVKKMLKTLEQKLENLQAIADMRADQEKVSAEKYQILFRKLERETKANKRLSMDKEELMYKLSTSLSSTPNNSSLNVAPTATTTATTTMLSSVQKRQLLQNNNNNFPFSMSASYTSGVTPLGFLKNNNNNNNVAGSKASCKSAPNNNNNNSNNSNNNKNDDNDDFPTSTTPGVLFV